MKLSRCLSVESKRKRAARSKRYHDRHPEKERVRRKEWNKRNREAARAIARRYGKKRRDRDPTFRLKNRLRNEFWKALRGRKRSHSALRLLGCTIESFKLYLESRFEPGMTWQNYGTVWEIDHIIPMAIFDLTKPEHQARCFHFSNLQPLFGPDNRAKGVKLVTAQFNLL